MSRDKDLAFKNIRAERIEVRHADLERYSDHSDYRAVCPVCKTGLLLVMRDRTTLQLIRYDRCTLCGQPVFYTDEMIAGEPLTSGSLPTA